MHRLLTALLFAVSITAAFAQITPPQTIEQQARAVVTRMQVGVSGVCSVVVVAPGEALTAWHCNNVQAFVRQGDKMLRVTKWEQIGTSDMARLSVPGLECPCADVLAGKAVMDEPVIAVGYPYDIGQILTRGDVQEYMVYQGSVFRVITAPVGPGNSGGGAFVIRDGRVYLLGIVSARSEVGSITLIVEVPRP